MSKPKKRRRRNWIVLLVLLALLGGGGSYFFLGKEDEVITVQTERVARRDLTETVVANGKIQPVTQVLISPEVAGEIIELPVKEGDRVKKGDLLVQIRPDNYKASRNSAEASHKSALGSRRQAEAELEKAAADFKRNEELFKSKLIPANTFADFKTAFEVARLRMENALHQVDQARFALDRADDDLAKTTISSPIDGTITKLKSQLGERVLGTSFNMGTEMMTVAQLEEMEARVDISEIDVVLIEAGQNAQIEVDAFRDRKFKGTVTAIANASKTGPLGTTSQSTEAPKFEVRIRVEEREAFRPGMSVTAEIETRSRQGVLSVPIQSVTTRLPPAGAEWTKALAQLPKPAFRGGAASDAKAVEPVKPVEVVFAVNGEHVKTVPVKTGISNGDHFEIIAGLAADQQIVSGSYKAISKDLDDGKKIKIGTEPAAPGRDQK